MQRSKHYIHPETFKMLMDLIKEKPWLINRSEALVELYNLCITKDERKLIEDLIRNFRFLDSGEIYSNAEKIANLVTKTWGYSPENTYFVAIADSDCADGSQAFLQTLKSHFGDKSGNWNELNFRHSITSVYELHDGANIILVDDFTGTGKKAERKIKWVKEKMEELNWRSCNLCFICLAGMELSLDLLCSTNITDFEIPILLKKGISDRYIGRELEKAISSMQSLESRLGERKNLQQFSFGYGMSEAIYSAETYGTPNNVFPIFWWSTLLDGTKRPTLFKRIKTVRNGVIRKSNI